MNLGTKNELIKNVVKFEDSIKSLKVNNESFFTFYSIISTLLSNDGYQTILTPSTGNNGLDLLCTKIKPAERIGVSVKLHKHKIESSEVLERISVAYNFPYNRMIIFGNEGFTSESYSLIKQYEPINVELLNLDDIKNWVSRIEVETILEKLEYENIIRVVSKTFIERIAADPNFLLKLEWRDVEKTIAEIFEGLAFKVKLTPPGKDGGKDLILEMTKDGAPITYIVEIKHWRSMQKVGQKYVKDFVEVVCNEKREKGLFISTYGFTENAFAGLTEFERTKVRFGNQEKIVSLSKTYLKVKSGIWTPLQDLQELLIENTN